MNPTPPFSRIQFSETLDTYRSVISTNRGHQTEAMQTELEQLQELFRLAYYDALNQQQYYARRAGQGRIGLN